MATISNVTFALGIAETPYSTEAAKNATYYYNTQGDATAEYFLTANVGTVTLSNGYANVSMTANLDKLNPGESKAYAIVIRRGSASGPIIASSNTINIINDDILFHQADGGNTVVSGGYKIHEFRSSANLIVTSVAAPVNNQVDYVIVAGGGGGGAVFGGGGGAGGMLTGTGSSSVITQAGNLLVIVGAGGNKTTTSSNGFPPATLGTRGGNSQLGSFIAVGGGVGRTYGERTPTPADLVSGGSGGGGATGTPPGGNGIPGQGNSGTASTPGGFGGAGGGAGGAGNNSVPASTGATGGIGLPITWTTPFIGTPGPTSGRWFSGGGGGGHNNSSGPPFGGDGGAGGGGPGGPAAGPGTIYTGGGGGGGSFVNGNESGNGGSGAAAIRYPFKPAPTYTVNSTVSRISNSSSMTYAIVTTGLTANARFYYTLTGNVTSADIDTGLSGSFIVSNNRADVQIVSNAAATFDTVFALQIRRLSTTGKILATGNTILIAPSPYIEATGGIVTDSGGYRIHTFTTSNSFVVSYRTSNTIRDTIDYLVVAGGGAGLVSGGGAGGFLSSNILVTETKTFNIVVGGGGSSAGTPGSNSSIDTSVISVGGGGGVIGPGPATTPGNAGGSGSGGFRGYTGTSPGGSGISGQGNPGGPAVSSIGVGSAVYSVGGGGGGAGTSGSQGTAGFPQFFGGSGGAGANSAITGANVTYAGGGGGGGDTNGVPGSGGVGGGGKGNPGPTAGGTNTGGGGGGGSSNGGSGIVIIRYPYQ